jgi:RNA polymerase-associated protein RTF1
LQERKNILDSKKDDDDESVSDFGDDSSDSDDDYDDGTAAKPWQQKKTKSTVSRLDQMDTDESADEGKGQKDPAAASKEAPPAELEDFAKVTIPRRRLARWCNEPFFVQAVQDSFVRLFLGEDDQGEKVYRLCQIVDVTKGEKTYKFPTANRREKPISTDKLLTLKVADSQKDFPMYLVSDAPPTEQDVIKYASMQKNHRKELLTKREATKLRRKQDELVNNYTYTTQDIEKNLEERKKQGALANLGAEQTKAVLAVQGAKDALLEANRALSEARKAIDRSSEADTHALNARLKECQNVVKACEKELHARKEEEQNVKEAVRDRKRRLTQRSKDRNWANVNKRNVNTNQRTDFQVSQKEKEAAVKKAASTATEKFNPFARRRVKPKILYFVGQADEQETQQEAKEEEKKESRGEVDENKAADVAPNLVQEQVNETVSQSHQFTIDEEVLAQSGANGLTRLASQQRRKKARKRKGISLADYLDQKAKGTL